MTFLKRTIAITAAAVAQTTLAQEATQQLNPVTVQGTRDRDSMQLDAPTAGTATRLGLTPRETPASVDILTQDVMRQRGSRTFTEALRTAPGVTGGNPPSAPTTLSTRGFTNLLYLYNGVRTSGAGAVNRVQDTWNYERIEILKGAASVLYGDTAIGGIVNFVAKRPDRENQTREGLLSYGSYGSIRAAVGVGGALSDAGAYRLDYSRNDTQVGTIARTGEKLDHLTTGVAFDLGTATRLDVSVDVLRDDNQGYFGTPLVPGTFATEPTSVVRTPDGQVIDRRVARNNYNVVDNDNSSTTYTGHVKLTHRLTPEWTLRNEFAANDAERTFRNSESAVFVAPDLISRDQTLITHDQRYIFNRLDASHRGSLLGRENRFVVGGEYGSSSFDSQRRFSDRTAATEANLRVPVLDPGRTTYNFDPAISTGGGNRVDTASDVRNLAIFVENSFKVTDALTLVGGYRHDHIDLERDVTDLNLGTATSYEARLLANSYRLGTVWALTSESNVYAQYTNATVPVSSLFLLSASNSTFPLSRGKQVEVGFKQLTADRRFEWTAAVYRIELDNVLSRDPANPNLTVNNGKQSSRGIELAAAWQATSHFSLAGNLALLRAKFDTLVEAGGVSRVGNRPTNVPQQVANLFANYRVAVLPVDLYLGLNRTGGMYTDTANTIRINGHTTADAAVTYRLGAAQLAFRVRNLTDKLYASYGGRATSQVLIAPGRTYELSALVSF